MHHTPPSGPLPRLSPEKFAEQQRQQSQREKERIERDVRAFKEHQEALAAELERIENEGRAAAAAALEEDLKNKYLSVEGSTLASWEQDKEDILRRYLVEATLAGGTAPQGDGKDVFARTRDGDRTFRVGKRF